MIRRLKAQCPTSAPLWLGLLGMTLITAQACQSPVLDSAAPFFFVDQLARKAGTYARADLPNLHLQGDISTAITIADETRRALAPPSPSRLTFAVDLPPNPVLRFAIAAATLGGRPTQRSLLEFRIFADVGRGEELCFSRTIERPKRNRWLDHQVDLGQWSGRKVQLTFDVRPTEQTVSNDVVFPIWGNPVLESQTPQAGKPMIVISVDCLRPDHVGAYGYRRDTTPRIDAFASKATIFNTAISTSSWTLTTHMSMLTGLNPSFHGVSRTRKLADDHPYLPDLLSQRGYETIGVVSSAYLSHTFGYDRNFHEYRTLKRPRASQTVDEALLRLRRKTHKNLFLFLHIIDPHWHYLPPEEFIERFGPRPHDVDGLMGKVIDREPPSGPEEIEQLINLYDAEIAYVDSELGRFFDELVSMNLYDSSLIVVTADHGEAFYEHGFWQHSDTLYEEMTRVPLIVKWPGQRHTGRSDVPVTLRDLYPTLLEEAGLDTDIPGARNLQPIAEGLDEEARSRILVSEVTWHRDGPNFMKVAVRNGDHKYISSFRTRSDDKLTVDAILDEELYDLSNDPGELVNLLQDPSVEVEPYRKKVLVYLDTAREYQKTRQGEGVILDEETRERLKRLGYLQ